MQTAEQLNTDFGLPGQLEFDAPYAGYPRAVITTEACSAQLFLQGAHLTQWQACDRLPALYLSPNSAFALGKAIRGGIPVIFPWFGSPETSPVHVPPGSPSHGFARTAPWTLQFAALAGEDLHLSLTLDRGDEMRALGFSDFELVYEAILGRSLTIRLSVGNTGNAPLLFEEALHSYLCVSETGDISVSGLKDTEFLDKTENFRRKTQTDTLLRFDGETDRPYLNTTAPVVLRDSGLSRSLTIAKTGSNSTVTWNPGPKLSAKLPDLPPEAWRRFVCIETSNVAENAITLDPGQVHVMEMRLTAEQR